MGTLNDFRQRYLQGKGEQVTQDLHALSIDQLITALNEIGINHHRSHGKPNALQKASRFIVYGTFR